MLRVVGVGGAGVNAVNRMVEAEIEGVEFLAINTDLQSLQQCTADVTVHIGAQDRPDIQALQKGAPGDILGELLDRDAGLDAPDIGLAEDQLVEGDVARAAEGDFLNVIGHGVSP